MPNPSGKVGYAKACQMIFGHVAGLEEACEFFAWCESKQIVMSRHQFGHALYRLSDVMRVAEMRRAMVPAK